MRFAIVRADNTVVEKDKLKQQASRRDLFIPDDLLETLIFHKQRQTVLKNTFKEYYQSDYVCTKNDGKRFRPEKLSYHFSKLLKKYNLPHIRLHDLRHTFISILYENGVAAKRLAQMAGHADPSIY